MGVDFAKAELAAGNAVEAKDLQEQGEGLPRSVDLTCTG
jgi:hypothetical protein